jgi:hypothetical protein
MVAEETSGRKSLLERVLQFLARSAIGADTPHDRSRPGSQAQEETIQEVPRCVWPHTKEGAQVYGIVRNTTGEGAEWQLYAIDVKTSAARTLLRWLQVADFKVAYLEARREAVSQAVAQMRQATGAAGVTILKLMTDPSVPAAVRLRAAECVLASLSNGSKPRTSRRAWRSLSGLQRLPRPTKSKRCGPNSGAASRSFRRAA